MDSVSQRGLFSDPPQSVSQISDATLVSVNQSGLFSDPPQSASQISDSAMDSYIGPADDDLHDDLAVQEEIEIGR